MLLPLLFIVVAVASANAEDKPIEPQVEKQVVAEQTIQTEATGSQSMAVEAQPEPVFVVVPKEEKPTSLVKHASTPLPETKVWRLNMEDKRLDRAIERWASEAGYTFRWDADRYLLISAPTQFKGAFLQAIDALLQTPGILYSEYPLEACVYANDPPLLRITRLGDQSRECN